LSDQTNDSTLFQRQEQRNAAGKIAFGFPLRHEIIHTFGFKVSANGSEYGLVIGRT